MALREKTKYTGVYVRTSKTKRHLGKPDVCFEFTYKANGKLIWEKAGWRSEGYTAVLASELRAERIRKTRHPEIFPDVPPKDTLTYGQAWEIFNEKVLLFLKSRITRTQHYTMHIAPVFRDVPLNEITSLKLESLKQKLINTEAIRRGPTGKIYRMGSSLSPATVNLILSDMTNVIRHMVEWGLYSGSVPRVKPLRVENERQRFLSSTEADRLLGLLEILSCRMYRIAVISLHTGMRVGEILKMRRQDLDFGNRLICVDGKMGKREAFMDETVLQMLQRIAPSHPAAFVLTTAKGLPIRRNNLTKVFTKAVDILGLNDGITDNRFKVVIHTFRHTFCSWLASQNVPLYTIGKLVGHANLRSTQRYAKLTNDAKWDALKLIEKTAKSIHHTS